MKTLIIVPTYNEKDNIQKLYESINSLNLGVDLLVVDDNSPDRTYEIVENLAQKNSNIFLLKRQNKEGLGKAYLAGFDWGLKKGYEVLVEMDADFSHRPKDLIPLLQTIKNGADAALGSRYVEGGGTVNWGLHRKLISQGGSFYSRLVLGYPIRDWTGGFNAWRREVLLAIGLENVNSEGYSFQIELKYKSIKKGFKIIESPIIFEERRAGQSKMSLRIFVEALYKVWGIRFF